MGEGLRANVVIEGRHVDGGNDGFGPQLMHALPESSDFYYCPLDGTDDLRTFVEVFGIPKDRLVEVLDHLGHVVLN
ncbi:MAG: hypothetical protein US92_C0011G0012 [Candidatus Peregrinibacteria bacterium GW2011_GWA2_38_36]|nr:MAG: hypothetical protein US92_C0011G0012 [Candidatus Peregrinibacteria bacterium GW2011_GWA2_38_36]